jgi:hypothetical protein
MKNSYLMSGIAGVTLMASLSGAAANAASTPGNNTAPNTPAAQSQLERPSAPLGNTNLEARFAALEAAMHDAQKRATQPASANNPPPASSGWWSNTSISGRMYYDVTDIENRANGVRVPGGGNGVNFDIKRFYIGIDHTFNGMFSANVTTDVTYDSGSSAGQIYLKKAYLQAKIDPLLTVRVGATDLPWISYVESIYGMRYFEQTLADRTKFGTSSDWGVHVLGNAFDGILNYDFAAINGGGYKKIPVGGGTNRADTFDYEGRVSAVYKGFNLAVGGYTGKLGTPYGTTTFHTAERFDVLGAYVADGLRVGVEYFNANDYSAALVASAAPGDAAHGVSTFASYYYLPEWAVFGRYDSVDTNTKTAPGKNDEFYTLGVTWSPTKVVDFSLAYKHEAVVKGSFSGGNGTIGSVTGAMRGTYNEFGIWGDFQF